MDHAWSPGKKKQLNTSSNSRTHTQSTSAYFLSDSHGGDALQDPDQRADLSDDILKNCWIPGKRSGVPGVVLKDNLFSLARLTANRPDKRRLRASIIWAGPCTRPTRWQTKRATDSNTLIKNSAYYLQADGEQTTPRPLLWSYSTSGKKPDCWKHGISTETSTIFSPLPFRSMPLLG